MEAKLLLKMFLSGGYNMITTEHKIKKILRENWQLYILLMPTLIYIIIFKYMPMYGVQIAFRDYNVVDGITGSKWVGLEHFKTFFNSFKFSIVLKNTLTISIVSLIFSFPTAVIVALLLNQFIFERYKRFIQTVIYAPHFISTVVLVGMMMVFLSPTSGLINKFIEMLGGEAIFFFGEPEWFLPIYVISGIWQGTGWGTIVYLAALSSVDPELYEAATIDGALRHQKIWYIDIPAIIPTIIIMLILSVGSIMNVGFEKVFLMQNSLNLDVSEIISTYVYKLGLLQVKYSLSTAVGLFNSLVNLVLLIIVNWVANRYSDGEYGIIGKKVKK